MAQREATPYEDSVEEADRQIPVRHVTHECESVGECNGFRDVVWSTRTSGHAPVAQKHVGLTPVKVTDGFSWWFGEHDIAMDRIIHIFGPAPVLPAATNLPSNLERFWMQNGDQNVSKSGHKLITEQLQMQVYF